MKSFRSYRYQYDKPFKQSANRRPVVALLSVFAIVAVCNILLFSKQQAPLLSADGSFYRRWHPVLFNRHRYSRLQSSKHDRTGRHDNGYNGNIDNTTGEDTDAPDTGTPPGGSTTPPATPPSTPPPATANVHSNITTTYFWVGEEAGRDNGGISNAPSAWDEQWQAHFGGVDSPTGRVGWLPGGFTPHENPFYFALPYNDFDGSGNRKPTATSCANANAPGLASYSWCKNTWIAISANGKTVYAQWEDVGPFGEDDPAYVFGTAAPKNTKLAGGGLDVSPAVHDYLDLGDVSKTSWWFVTAPPAGPWTQIVTTSVGDSNN